MDDFRKPAAKLLQMTLRTMVYGTCKYTYNGVITCYNPTLVTEGNVILDQNGVSKLSKKCVPKNQKRVVRFKPSLNKPVQFVAVTICYPFYVGICLMGLSDVCSRPDVFPDHL